MNKDDFESFKRGLAQVADYKAGARMGYAVHEPMDIKAIRAKTKLTQAAFADRLHISAATLRDWEQGRRVPDAPARTLLGMVNADPDAAFKLLAKVPA
ncbi:MAG: transcriptional regulator [Alphaproteobacteria bacterium HGW-Alphaproteobacteria-13]|nr:MAG: transcriptional regulator [Alphaproteobacteria bacterium HGW-Alphaproteobacteria-13]